MDSTRIALNVMSKTITNVPVSRDTAQVIYRTSATIVPHRSLGTDANARDSLRTVMTMLGDEYDSVELIASVWLMSLPDEVLHGDRLYQETAKLMLTFLDPEEPTPPPAQRLAEDLKKLPIFLFLYYYHRATLVGGMYASTGTD